MWRSTSSELYGSRKEIETRKMEMTERSIRVEPNPLAPEYPFILYLEAEGDEAPSHAIPMNKMEMLHVHMATIPDDSYHVVVQFDIRDKRTLQWLKQGEGGKLDRHIRDIFKTALNGLHLRAISLSSGLSRGVRRGDKE